MLLSCQVTTRLILWENAELDIPSSPNYSRDIVAIENEKDTDYLLDNAPPEHHELIARLNSTIADRNIMSAQNIENYCYRFDEIEELASRIYGPECELLACEYSLRGYILLRQGMTSEAKASFMKVVGI